MILALVLIMSPHLLSRWIFHLSELGIDKRSTTIKIRGDDIIRSSPCRWLELGWGEASVLNLSKAKTWSSVVEPFSKDFIRFPSCQWPRSSWGKVLKSLTYPRQIHGLVPLNPLVRISLSFNLVNDHGQAEVRFLSLTYPSHRHGLVQLNPLVRISLGFYLVSNQGQAKASFMSLTYSRQRYGLVPSNPLVSISLGFHLVSDWGQVEARFFSLTNPRQRHGLVPLMVPFLFNDSLGELQGWKANELEEKAFKDKIPSVPK